MPKRPSSGDVIRVLEKHGFRLVSQKVQPQQIQAAQRAHCHCAAPQEGTPHWNHSLHYPPVWLDTAGLWILMPLLHADLLLVRFIIGNSLFDIGYSFLPSFFSPFSTADGSKKWEGIEAETCPVFSAPLRLCGLIV